MARATQTPGVDRAYRGVLERLRGGVFRAGQRLPGERSLAVELGVSRSSLRSALALLADEKWIASSYKRGWFVRDDAVGEPLNTLVSFTEMAAARGLSAQAAMIDWVERPSGYEEAARLRIAPSSPVIELVRVRSMDHVPICVDRATIPSALVPGLTADDLEDRSLFDVLDERFGLVVGQSSYTIGADLMGERNAMLLDVSPGSAALVAEEVVESRDGVPLIASVLTYRGGAYRFSARLYRN